MPVVSVIVPVYNAEKYLERCVDSLVNQSLTDIEIILVDDGSKDSSASICDGYAKKDSRVRVLHIPNGGVSNARNAGIRIASGEYLSFVDSDDWVELNAYGSFASHAFSTGADVVYCDCYEHYTNHKVKYQSFSLGMSLKDTIHNMLISGPRGGNIWMYYIRRSVVVDNELSFPASINRGEDFCFALSVLCCSSIISKLDICLYNYNLTNVGSLTHNEVVSKDNSYLNFMDRCIDFLKSRSLWKEYCADIYWRILLEKTVWAVRPSCFKCYLEIHPEANAFVSSNPLLGSKMKLLMSQLNKRHYITSALMALAYRMKVGR